jgi:hypothetical protein
MNHITKSTLILTVLALVGTAFLGGCGPENIDGFANDSAMINDAADKDAAPAKTAMPAVNDDDEAVVVPATKVVTAPTAVVQLPSRYVRLPSQAQTEAPVITNSREDREFAQDIYHQRNIHVYQPNINKHLIHKNLMINKKFHTTVINHPSYRNDVAMTSSVGETNEELPTTVVTSPTVTYGGFYNVGYGVRPGCARWLSGGFHRNCGGALGGAWPVVGPYYR